jgi:hypothetical protein
VYKTGFNINTSSALKDLNLKYEEVCAPCGFKNILFSLKRKK